MVRVATVRARIDPELKSEVEHLFKELGISTTEAITMFYHQVKLRHELPFDLVVPSKTTEKMLKDTDAEINLICFDNAEDSIQYPD